MPPTSAAVWHHSFLLVTATITPDWGFYEKVLKVKADVAAHQSFFSERRRTFPADRREAVNTPDPCAVSFLHRFFLFRMPPTSAAVWHHSFLLVTATITPDWGSTDNPNTKPSPSATLTVPTAEDRATQGCDPSAARVRTGRRRRPPACFHTCLSAPMR